MSEKISEGLVDTGKGAANHRIVCVFQLGPAFSLWALNDWALANAYPPPMGLSSLTPHLGRDSKTTTKVLIQLLPQQN